MRTIVASMMIATVMPRPMILMLVSVLVRKTMNTTASSSAAAVMMPAERCRPNATAEVLSPVRSYSSLIRDSRNTS